MIQVVVNYWAVAFSAVVNMALGFMWFGPLFGKKWIKLMGWTAAEMQAGKKKMEKDGWKTYLLALVGSLVMACALAHSLVFSSSYLGISGLVAGIKTGFFSWLGFVAPITLGTVLWEGKSWKLWCLTNSYYVVALMIMGSILALWK